MEVRLCVRQQTDGRIRASGDLGRMIVLMMDANYISERLASLKQEMSDLGISNARFWNRKEHTALDKSARALRQSRLLEINRELADMMKRCA